MFFPDWKESLIFKGVSFGVEFIWNVSQMFGQAGRMSALSGYSRGLCVCAALIHGCFSEECVFQTLACRAVCISKIDRASAPSFQHRVVRWHRCEPAVSPLWDSQGVWRREQCVCVCVWRREHCVQEREGFRDARASQLQACFTFVRSVFLFLPQLPPPSVSLSPFL